MIEAEVLKPIQEVKDKRSRALSMFLWTRDTPETKWSLRTLGVGVSHRFPPQRCQHSRLPDLD